MSKKTKRNKARINYEVDGHFNYDGNRNALEGVLILDDGDKSTGFILHLAGC